MQEMVRRWKERDALFLVDSGAFGYQLWFRRLCHADARQVSDLPRLGLILIGSLTQINGGRPIQNQMNASASHRLAAHRRGRARRSSGACRDFFLHRLGPRRLNGSPSSDQVNYQNYQCEYQKQVNESTHRVTGYQAHQPKNQKNYEDCPQHGCFLPYQC